MAISCCQRGEIKNSNQNENLEKDGEKEIRLHKNPKWCQCPQCRITSVESFPFNWFMQVYLSGKRPSHQLDILHISISWFPALCLTKLEDGLLLRSILQEVIWMSSVLALLFILFRRHNGAGWAGTDDGLLLSHFSFRKCELLILSGKAQPFFGQHGQLSSSNNNWWHFHQPWRLEEASHSSFFPVGSNKLGHKEPTKDLNAESSLLMRKLVWRIPQSLLS